MTYTSSITAIPLNKLTAWDGNVRKTAGDDKLLAELAASIHSHGLINNLVVRPGKNGTHAVVAGGRRFAALQLLADQGKIPADKLIDCNLIAEDSDATEISLAENFVREEMHPADEFDAFKALADKGLPASDIAARFGVTEGAVLSRMKLARVSPVIIKAYRDGKTNLDCVMAFAVTDDNKRQERLWKTGPAWMRTNAHSIRSTLVEGEIDASDRRVRFVTLDAYEKAGGTVRRDLFTEGDEGIFITKPDILNQLVTEKVDRKIQSLLDTGWKWAELLRHDDYQTVLKFKPMRPAGKKDTFTAAQMAVGGVFLQLKSDGRLDLQSGYVKREDAKAAKSANPVANDAKPKPAQKSGMSQSLTDDLIGQRTAAIAAILADTPRVALVAVIHTLGLNVFYSQSSAPLDFDVQTTSYPVGFAERCKPRGLVELDKIRLDWKKTIPSKQTEFWQWCIDASDKTLLSLLAFIAALTCEHSDQLASSLDLDMSKWFTPNAANFFGRLRKPDILVAIKEGTGKGVSPATEKLKTGELAAFAERTLKDTGWLPKLLRRPDAKPAKKPLKKAA